MCLVAGASTSWSVGDWRARGGGNRSPPVIVGRGEEPEEGKEEDVGEKEPAVRTGLRMRKPATVVVGRDEERGRERESRRGRG